MSSRTIEIIVETNGSTRVQTRGFTGSACIDASRFIEEALGKRTSKRNTPEFFQTTEQQQRLQEGGS